MENHGGLEKKYGLFTAICMVVGIVIGSGVFFKAQTILEKTEGNMPMGILAWFIGGAIMLLCILTFGNMAGKYEKVNGIVDYAEATVSGKYAYMVGWFLTTIYYPTLTMALAWLSARYTLVFLTSVAPDFPLLISVADGGCIVGPECMALTMLYLCCSFAVNALSPKLAGKFQTTTTVIKLIPLALMAVVGVIVGITSGVLTQNFDASAAVAAAESANKSTGTLLFTAVCATSFAYEGWIIATSINSELHNAKKNLPKALFVGGIVIIAVYILYFIGVAGGASTNQLIEEGATVAFTNVFGKVLGNILNLFVAISCMGTMNGLMLGCSRGMYSIAVRRRGIKPEIYSQVDKQTNMAANSAILGLVFCAAWMFYFYLSNLAGTWSGAFVFDPTELPIVTIYAFYLPIFFMWMKKEKTESFGRRFLLPILATVGSLFMILACIIAHKMGCVWYLIVFAVIMLVGLLFARDRKNKNQD